MERHSHQDDHQAQGSLRREKSDEEAEPLAGKERPPRLSGVAVLTVLLPTEEADSIMLPDQ